MKNGAPGLALIREKARESYSALKLKNMVVEELQLDPMLPMAYARHGNDGRDWNV
jgi:hypothetical protein